MSDYDCVVVFPHGLVTSKEKISSKLSEIAKDIDTNVPIICTSQQWYFLEHAKFESFDRCIHILPRNPEVLITDSLEVLYQVEKIFIERDWWTVGLVAHPNFQPLYTQYIRSNGLDVVSIDCSSVS
jgi:hypothetical protein